MWGLVGESIRLCLRRPFVLVFTLWIASGVSFLPYLAPSDPEKIFEWIDLVSFLVNIITWGLSLGALAHVFDAAYRKEKVNVFTAYQAAFKKFPALVWNMFVVMLFAMIGMLCFIVPGIYLMIRYSFVPNVIMLEEPTPGYGPRRRSWKLTDGYEWYIFFVFAIPFFIMMSISMVVFVPMMLDGVTELPASLYFLSSLSTILFLPSYAFAYVCFKESSDQYAEFGDDDDVDVEGSLERTEGDSPDTY